MPKCLITGGAGFIGSHLAISALRMGWEVAVLDNLSTGWLSNLPDIEDGVRFFHGDVRDPEALLKASEGVEIIFHLAALVSVPLSIEDPILSANINDIGTLNVFEAARNNGVRRVVHSSSAAVYGQKSGIPNLESMTPAPMSPYAAHKLIGEHYGSIYSQEFGVEAVSLRYFNVFGPRQDPRSPYSGVISIFADCLAEDRAPTIFGDGEQTRDFIFVEDVVRANLLAAKALKAEGQVVNVGTGKPISVNTLWKTMGKIAGKTITPSFNEERAGDIKDSLAAVDEAIKVLAFNARIGLEEGLEKTISWANSEDNKR
jgi:nucleoside-diphosphate-sugar epimerase